jgi:peroxiredoxin
VARRYAGQVAVIGVPSSDTVEAMRGFVERHGLQDVPQAVDHDRVVWDRFSIPGQPAWAFVHATTGEVRRHLGPLGAEGISAALDDLVRD